MSARESARYGSVAGERRRSASNAGAGLPDPGPILGALACGPHGAFSEAQPGYPTLARRRAPFRAHTCRCISVARRRAPFRAHTCRCISVGRRTAGGSYARLWSVVGRRRIVGRRRSSGDGHRATVVGRRRSSGGGARRAAVVGRRSTATPSGPGACQRSKSKIASKRSEIGGGSSMR